MISLLSAYNTLYCDVTQPHTHTKQVHYFIETYTQRAQQDISNGSSEALQIVTS